MPRLSARDRQRIRSRRLRDGLTAAELAAEYGVSERTIYRALDGDGVQLRKRRRDAGASRVELSAEQWRTLAALVLRDDYPAGEAIRVCEANGVIPRGRVSAAWLNRRLRDAGADKRTLARHGPQTWVRRERRGPNVEHQADGSPAASIYLDLSGDILYEPHDPLKKHRKMEGKTRVHIFCLEDAYSRVTYRRAYDGETADNWMDFLWRAWAQKADPRAFPFCGLPRVLYTDGGSGLVSPVTRRALREIGVEAVPHAPGEAWKKGKVERAQQTYQVLCEVATRQTRFASLDEFNIFLSQADLYLNNKRHSSIGETPLARWRDIAPADLVLPPEWAEWRRLCLHEERVRVRGDWTITFGQGRARETVELPHTDLVARYVGKRIVVRYVPHASDAILLELHALAGLRPRELRVERVRPGSRPVAQQRNVITFGEHLKREAAEADTSGLDLTAHWREAVEQHPVPEAGRRVEIDAARLWRPRHLSRIEATRRAQDLGLVGTPPADGERAWLDGVFAGRETISEEAYDEAMEDYRNEQRRAPTHAAGDAPA